MLTKQIAFEFTRPEIEGGPRRRFAMPFWPNVSLQKKRQTAETALQNAFKDHLLDFEPVNSNAICFVWIK